MDNIDIYYDNHTPEQFLTLLPLIGLTFIRIVRSFYKEKNEFEKFIFDKKMYNESTNLQELEKVIEVRNNKVDVDNLLIIIYMLYYLSNENPPFTNSGIGIELYSSYKRLYMIPGNFKLFNKSMATHEKRKFQVFQLELFERLILLTDPFQINIAEDQFNIAENPDAEYEYVKDPYLLALEFMRTGGEHEYEHVIDVTSGQYELLDQIKKVISVEEILEICYQYAKPDQGYYIKYYPETGGIARFSLDHYTCHYPRFFIRKELRKRGIPLLEGNSEKWMRSYFGDPWRKKCEGKEIR